MAHQDYVARPRATKKKKNPYKGKPKKSAAKAGLGVKTVVTLILVIIVGFVTALTFMKDNAPDIDATDIKLSPTPPNVIQDDLPEPPTEKWTYMTDLKTKEVEVGSYEVKDKGPYQMQCGSFRTMAKAQQLKAQIAFTGLASQIRKTQGKNGLWYKVVLGPFERKRMAEKAKHKLKNNKINYCQIWLWT